jgi:SOUL heme-binding protein
MTEQQRYEVLQRQGSVELRLYEACTVADVVVQGSEEQAGNAAFRPLLGYITGGNESRRKLAMTAPVVQERVSERLAMTAPVIQQATDHESWTVSFVLPGSRPPDEYPLPTDPLVTLRHVPEHTAAALRWSGRWTRANVARRTEELDRAIAAAGWTPQGVARWARFDPPWKPAFARRNEVVMPVSPDHP